MPDTSSLLNLPRTMNKLHLVASLMDNWTRLENDALTKIAEAQAEQVCKRNRYIAELQEDFERLARIVEIQRAALNDATTAVVILQNRVDNIVPNLDEVFLVANDPNNIPHVIRVQRGLAFEGAEIIDLTTDEELDDTQPTEQPSQEF